MPPWAADGQDRSKPHLESCRQAIDANADCCNRGLATISSINSHDPNITIKTIVFIVGGIAKETGQKARYPDEQLFS